MKKPYLIGIAGGTGSGKTTVVAKIAEKFAPEVLVITHDNYYRDLSLLSQQERAKQNFDHPDALDTELLVAHLKKLLKGESVKEPVYDFTQHVRTSKTNGLESSAIIVVEGILIFENEQLRNLFDLKVFVDADSDIRFIRRVLRDIKKRGRTLDSVVDQYLTTVKPMHNEFVEPSKKFADVIIPEGGFNEVALGILFEKIVEGIK
ncbi:uridine kinase [Candidatus Curtissbacteria bacterium]|nr:uridine kinase [Candidatus Curtissbacteria bacterium]